MLSLGKSVSAYVRVALLSIVLIAPPANAQGNEPQLNVDSFCGYLAGSSNSQGSGSNLCEVLKKSIEQSPTAKSQELSLKAYDGRVEQAGLTPNPALLSDYDKRNEELTFQLSQTIELGGKRGDRINVATQEKENSKVTFSAGRLELIQELKSKFIEVLFLQEKLELSTRRNSLAVEILGTSKKRLEAGRGMPVESIKADLAVTASELEVRRLKSELQNAKRQLSALLGSNGNDESSVSGDLRVLPISPSSIQQIAIESTPSARKARLNLDLKKANLALAQGNAYPDVTVSAGVKYFRDEKEKGYVVGLALPLPVHNRNQGSVNEAKSELAASEFELTAESLKTQANLSSVLQDLEIAYSEAATFKDRIVPSAEKAFSSAIEIFRRGKLDYLNVLDAQRDLFNSQEQYFQSLVMYHKALSELERISGKGALELSTRNADAGK